MTPLGLNHGGRKHVRELRSEKGFVLPLHRGKRGLGGRDGAMCDDLEGLWAQAGYNGDTVSLINPIQRLRLSIGASGPFFLMDVSRLGDLRFLYRCTRIF